MKLYIYRVNNFIKKEIPAQIFSCEFCEISHDTIFKEPFGQLLPHKYSVCLLSHHDLLFFQKQCQIYFPAEHFLGLTYRLGTRISSIFQTFSKTPIFNPVKHLRWSFFSKIVNSLKQLSIGRLDISASPCPHRHQHRHRHCKNFIFVLRFFFESWNILQYSFLCLDIYADCF